jgi:hypothetical protein
MAEEKRDWYAAVNDLQRQFNERVRQSWIGRTAGWIDENIMPAMYAFTRQGAKEFAQVLPAFPDSVKPVEELGTMGNPTQLSVNQEQGNSSLYQRDKGYEEWLDWRAAEIAREPEGRGMDREL